MAYGNGGSYGEATGVIGARIAAQCDTTSGPSSPPRLPAVSAQLERAEKHTQALHLAISELETRISMILSPEPPHSEGAGNKPLAPVALAGALEEINNQIGYALERLGRLTNRIEL